MKLKDILKTANFKFPNGYEYATQDKTGQVFVFRETSRMPDFYNGLWVNPTGQYRCVGDYLLAEDFQNKILYKTEFEKTWDGTLPPPVGIDVDVHFENDDYRVWIPFRVEYFKDDTIVLHDYRTDSVCAYSYSSLDYRPVKTEEEKQREEQKQKAINQMVAMFVDGHIKSAQSTYFSDQDLWDMGKVYDAILKGEIKIV